MKFKKGDVVIRITNYPYNDNNVNNGKFMMKGRRYIVKEQTSQTNVYLKGDVRGYNAEMFELDKGHMIKKIIDDL